MYLCVFVHMYTHICMCICIHIYMYIYMYKHMYIYTYECIYMYIRMYICPWEITLKSEYIFGDRKHPVDDKEEGYGEAKLRRLLKIIGLFCKRVLSSRRYSAKETYNLKEPTNRNHPISARGALQFQPQWLMHWNMWLFIGLFGHMWLFRGLFWHMWLWLCKGNSVHLRVAHWLNCVDIYRALFTYAASNRALWTYVAIYRALLTSVAIYRALLTSVAIYRALLTYVATDRSTRICPCCVCVRRLTKNIGLFCKRAL